MRTRRGGGAPGREAGKRDGAQGRGSARAGLRPKFRRKALAPLLFDDEELEETRRTRDPVAPAQPSAGARRKKARAAVPGDSAPMDWRTLLSRLATLVRNECAFGSDERTRIPLRRETRPDAWQLRAFLLLSDYAWPVKRTQKEENETTPS